MKRHLKAVLSALLAVIMLITAVPFAAFAETRSETPPVSDKAILIGDADQNGSITIADAIIIARIALGLQQANSPCDINQDGQVSIADAILSARQALSLLDWVYAVDFTLRADKNVVFSDDSDREIRLYLETDLTIPSIQLFYGYNGNLSNSIIMNDNATDADDIAGDGVYSAKITPYFSSDSELHFVARYGEMESNDVEVNCFMPISDDTFDAMDAVDEAIDELLSSHEFNELTYENRVSEVVDLLQYYENHNMVMQGSIRVNEALKQVSFMYPEGILGCVFYGEWEPRMDGGFRTTNNASEPNGDCLDSINDIDSITRDIGSIGDAIILNSFPGFETTPEDIEYRTTFYETLRDNWNASGLDTTLIVNPTVNDYRDIDEYNVICISTHGSRYAYDDGFMWSNHHEYSAICLSERQSSVSNRSYKSELKNKEIVKANGCYWILPAFFENKFSDSDFSNSFVFCQCCQSMGTGAGNNSDNYDYTMSNAFVNNGASAYIGYHNSVLSDYGREFMAEYINCLIEGKNSIQSFNSAIELMGSNHEIWYNNHHDISLQEAFALEGRVFNPLVDVAYPVHRGNGNSTLVNQGIQNGGFESNMLFLHFPKKWKRFGDVRSVTRVGSISTATANSTRMAIITTGIGSQQSEYFENGTEGSMIYQTFIVPSAASMIRFQYNFVSEEPMEYVGDAYDDSFCAQIVKGGSLVYNNTYESINTSNWFPADGVNFIGGDTTAFQTGWKTVEIDVSAYRNEVITLCFVVYDVGDEKYDSACLLDNVVLE